MAPCAWLQVCVRIVCGLIWCEIQLVLVAFGWFPVHICMFVFAYRTNESSRGCLYASVVRFLPPACVAAYLFHTLVPFTLSDGRLYVRSLTGVSPLPQVPLTHRDSFPARYFPLDPAREVSIVNLPLLLLETLYNAVEASEELVYDEAVDISAHVEEALAACLRTVFAEKVR